MKSASSTTSATLSPAIQAVFYGNPDYYPPIVNELRMLDRSRYRVHLICREYRQRWKVRYPESTRLTRVSGPTSSSLREYANFLARVFRRADRDARIYIGHDMHGFLAARLLAWRYRRPVVYRCHDFAERGRPAGIGARMVMAFEFLFARTADLVVVPDRERGIVIARVLGLRRPPLVVANAPLCRPRTGGDALRDALAERGYSFSRIVLRQGSIGPGHAIEATIRSIPLWADAGWGFVLLGFCTPEYERALRTLAREYEVDHRLCILPPVSYDDVARFTPGADLGHGLYEPIHTNNKFTATASNKVLEYMAAELPVLVSNATGLRATIESHSCGVVANEGDPVDIARAVNAALAREDVRTCMGRNAVCAFERHFRFDLQFRPLGEMLDVLAGVDA